LSYLDKILIVTMDERELFLDDVINDTSDLPGSFQVIEPAKFVILSVMTLGIYPIWWSYKLWRFFKLKDNLDITPVLRAIFSILFLYSLFSRIRNFAEEQGYAKTFSPGWMFTGLLSVSLLSYIPGDFWILGLFSNLFMLPPLNAINYAVEQSGCIRVIRHSSLNGRQVILILVGIILWILVLIGRFSAPVETDFRF